MTDPASASSTAPGTPSGSRPPLRDEVSFLDIGVILAEHRSVISRTVLVVVLVGLLIALFSPARFSSTAIVVPEAEAEPGLLGSSALSAIRGFGLTLGSQTGLTPEAYPEIVESQEVLLAVARDTMYYAELGRPSTFVSYVQEKNDTWFNALIRNTVGAVARLVRSFLSPATPTAPPGDGLEILTRAELDAIYVLADHVSTSQDLETGLMAITVTSSDAVLSATLAQAFVEKLRERIRTVRTQKSRENVAFIVQQFIEAEEALREAETALAQFDDRNINPQSARLRTERDRLLRQVTFATQLYSDLQTQRTQAQIELQRSEPVVTVLESPAVPLNPSSPKRKLILVLSLLVGLGLGVTLAFTRALLQERTATSAEFQKLQTIKAAFLPKRWRS